MGPVCTILINDELSLSLRNKIDNFLRSIAFSPIEESKVSREFWVDHNKFPKINPLGSDCQFMLSYRTNDQVVEELIQSTLRSVFNFEIKSLINLSAGCNQRGDHFVLGELCYEIAKRVDGLIDFHGKLGFDSSFDLINSPGVLYGIEYNQGAGINHVSDPTFMKYWLNQECFSMIK